MESAEFEPEEWCDQLFIWFQSLPISTPYQTIHDLSSGEAFAEALRYLDEAEFSDLTASEKELDQAGFLQSLRDRMVEYIEEKQEFSTAKSLRSLKKRLEDDLEVGGLVAVSRIIQLVLVCAVLSPGKEEHIMKMQELDEKVTVGISNAILQVLPVQNNDDSAAVADYVNANEDCHNCATLQSEISHLNDERKRLLAANSRLKTDLDEATDVHNERSPANRKVAALQKETLVLKENLEKSQISKDEFKLKCEEFQNELNSTIIQFEQLERKVSQIDRLNVELNEWKQTAGQFQKYENEVKIYKRKLDDVGDLRQQMKTIENRNTELMKLNLELEQENGNVAVLKSEVEVLRSELNAFEQENALCGKRLESEQQHVADLKDQIADLKQRNEILESERSSSHVRTGSEEMEDGMLSNRHAYTSLGDELLPPSVKEEMLRLKMENEELLTKLQKNASISISPPSPPSPPEKKGRGKDEESDMLVQSEERDSDRDRKESIAARRASNARMEAVEVERPSDPMDTLLAQRDAQIQALENQLQFQSRNYSQQQKLITAAWYRMTIKMEQQAANARLVATTLDIERPLSFLEEQRKAVNSPVVNAFRVQNTATANNQMSSYRTQSRSFLR